MSQTPVMSSKQRKALKAKAHHLKPVIMVGQNGISEGVVKETDIALKTHELIKIQIQSDDRKGRLQGAQKLAEQLGAELVQHIGKICVLYRANES